MSHPITEGLLQRVSELEAEVERLKCCGNCEHLLDVHSKTGLRWVCAENTVLHRLPYYQCAFEMPSRWAERGGEDN